MTYHKVDVAEVLRMLSSTSLPHSRLNSDNNDQSSFTPFRRLLSARLVEYESMGDAVLVEPEESKSESKGGVELKSEHASERISERTSERTSERKSERTSERKSERTSERKSERHSEREGSKKSLVYIGNVSCCS